MEKKYTYILIAPDEENYVGTVVTNCKQQDMQAVIRHLSGPMQKCAYDDNWHEAVTDELRNRGYDVYPDDTVVIDDNGEIY